MADTMLDTKVVMNAGDGWDHVFRLMADEDKSIPTEEDYNNKSGECEKIFHSFQPRLRELTDGNWFKRAWLVITGEDDKILAADAKCQSEWERVFGLHTLAHAVARRAVALADETGVGRLTQGEINRAKSYALSLFAYYRRDVLPGLKKTSVADNPLLTLSDEINRKSEEIARTNYLEEKTRNRPLRTCP